MKSAPPASESQEAATIREQIATLLGLQAERREMSPTDVAHLTLVLRELLAAPSPDRPAPAVPVEDSIQPDFLICLETGQKIKMLRRHLTNVLGMTPEEYRRKWQLPADYPMTAPSYGAAKARARQASGLDRYGRQAGSRRE